MSSDSPKPADEAAREIERVVIKWMNLWLQVEDREDPSGVRAFGKAVAKEAFAAGRREGLRVAAARLMNKICTCPKLILDIHAAETANG